MVKRFFKVLSFASVFTLFAQSVAASDMLVVTDADGGKTSFMLNDKPVVSFNTEDMVISTESTTVSYSLKDFYSFSFEDIATSVDDFETFNPTFAFSDGLQCYGLPNGSSVEVYNANGVKVSSGVIGADGRVNLSFNAVKGTVYIVKTATRTFKFIK